MKIESRNGVRKTFHSAPFFLAFFTLKPFFNNSRNAELFCNELEEFQALDSENRNMLGGM